MRAVDSRPLRMYGAFARDGGVRFGAAVAYYSLFAFAPMMILAISGAQAVFGSDRIAAVVEDVASGAVGDDVGALIGSLASEALGGRYSTSLGVIGAGLVLWSVWVAFSQLQASIDAMWHVRLKADLSFNQGLRVQVRKLAFVLLPAALLVAAVLASSMLAWALEWFPLDGLEGAVSIAGSPGAICLAAWLALTTTYRFMPNVRVRLRQVAIPALVVAVAWTIGTVLYGIYLSYVGTASASGAAGAVFLLLVWMNYTARAILFGCWVCRFNAEKIGPLEPLPRAELVSQPDRS